MGVIGTPLYEPDQDAGQYVLYGRPLLMTAMQIQYKLSHTAAIVGGICVRIILRLAS